MTMRLIGVLLLLSLFSTTPACLVAQSKYEACLGDLGKTRQSLEVTGKERDALKTDRDALSGKLTEAVGQNQELVTKISSMGHNVEDLLGEKDKLSQERLGLKTQVDELTRMHAQAQQREAEYRTLMDKLHKMIDAGTLQVKVRGGRMLVQMSSDLLFPPGGVHLKAEAKESIAELANTLKSFPDRRFQVVGHSDATPISTARFPSNWELSAGRAIEMVKVLVDAGVPPEMVSAAGNAEFDPLEPNDSPDHKLANRRVELVFMPKIDELPGFSDALKTPGTATTPPPAAPDPKPSAS